MIISYVLSFSRFRPHIDRQDCLKPVDATNQNVPHRLGLRCSPACLCEADEAEDIDSDDVDDET